VRKRAPVRAAAKRQPSWQEAAAAWPTVSPWPEDADDSRLCDILAGELLTVCLRALKSYGISSRRLMQLASEAAADRSRFRSRARDVLTAADRLTQAMNKWSEDPAYRDATGRPAVLALTDCSRRTFVALAREFFPGWSLNEVVSLGQKAKVLERVGKDKVALINNCVLFTGNSALILAYSIRTIRRAFCAANYNRKLKSTALDGWPDRAAWVEVSEDDFREFARFIRPQISDLMEMSNRWLFKRASLPRNRLKKKRSAGIQAFVFRE